MFKCKKCGHEVGSEACGVRLSPVSCPVCGASEWEGGEGHAPVSWEADLHADIARLEGELAVIAGKRAAWEALAPTAMEAHRGHAKRYKDLGKLKSAVAHQDYMRVHAEQCDAKAAMHALEVAEFTDHDAAREVRIKALIEERKAQIAAGVSPAGKPKSIFARALDGAGVEDAGDANA